MEDQAQSQPLSSSQWFWLGLFILAGLLLRWLELEVRPIHHDESMHAMFGVYYFDWPEDKFYKYDPMMHGPVLYNLYPLIYTTLGITDWSIRAPIALIGSFFLFIPLIFRRYFSYFTLLASTAALALSPTMVYWSRLIHHDELVLLGWVLMAVGVFLASDQRKSLWVLSGIALQWCVKANVYITLALIVGYLVYEFALTSAFVQNFEASATRLRRFVARHWASVAAGFCLAAFIFSAFYSSGFRYPEGILDGLYRKGFSYWLHQHNIERIVGPFMFHFYVLSWYELPFIGLMLFQAYLLYRQAFKPVQVLCCGALIVAFVCAFSTLATEVPKNALWAFFKLKDRIDIIGLVLVSAHALLITTHHLLRRERGLAFFGYFFMANFFSYSYAGEKTPWLAIYPFVAGLIYLALYFQDYFERTPVEDWKNLPFYKVLGAVGCAVFALGFLFTLEQTLDQNWGWLAAGAILIGVAFCDSYLQILGRCNLRVLVLVCAALFTLRASILTNFVYAGHANELISQVHTTTEFDGVLRDIRRQLLIADEAKRPEVLVTGEGVWPTVWYLRGLPLRYDADPEKLKGYKWIFQDWKDNPTDLPEGFELRKLKLRGWWVPDYSQMTLKRFLNFALNHTPWKPGGGGDPSGYSYITMLTRKSP